MIKNFIFDLGGVIFDYNPKKYIQSFSYDDKTTEFLTKEVFYGKEWMRLATQPTGSFKEILNDIKFRIPYYSKQIDELESGNWKSMLSVNKNEEQFFIETKNKGFKVYILSDLSADGGTYSYEVGSNKPNKIILMYC